MILRLLVKHLNGWSYKETAERVANVFAQEQATTDPGLWQPIYIQIHRIYLRQYPFIVLIGETDLAVVREGDGKIQLCKRCIV